jgi:ATP-dependent Clp protease, protease subunit
MAKKDVENRTAMFHDYSIDIPSRTIWMGSERVTMSDESGTDAQMAERIIKNLTLLDSVSGDPITILMNNPGGDWHSGMAIVDRMLSCRSSITIVGLGQIFSMGSVIFQAADNRIMTPNAIQMLHYGFFGVEGETKTVQKWAKESQRIDAKTEQIYFDKMKVKNPKITLHKVKELLDRDTILTAEESIELGLADSILEVKK